MKQIKKKTQLNVNGFHLHDSWSALLCQHKASITFTLHYLSSLIKTGQAERVAACADFGNAISAFYPKASKSSGHKESLLQKQIFFSANIGNLKIENSLRRGQNWGHAAATIILDSSSLEKENKWRPEFWDHNCLFCICWNTVSLYSKATNRIYSEHLQQNFHKTFTSKKIKLMDLICFPLKWSEWKCGYHTKRKASSPKVWNHFKS